jgi:HEPN domain-containing protein
MVVFNVTRTSERLDRIFMGQQEKYQYWLSDALYDLDTADAMYNTGRWFYTIFMCQQAIEKLAKALFGLYNDSDHVPFSHNIETLFRAFDHKLPEQIPPETWDLFGELSQYAVNKRYPDLKRSCRRGQRNRKHRDICPRARGL